MLREIFEIFLPGNKKATRWTRRMKKDWDERAKQNAKHYIMTEKPEWSLDDFFASGEAHIQQFVDPFLKRYGITKPGHVLELGCGIGRLTKSLSKRFEHVDAVDVSLEMIKEAKRLLGSIGNIRFLVNNGKDLRSCGSGRYDMVFSYIVLQHIPDQKIVYNYFREFGRVLKVGGLFLFQASNNDLKGHLKYLERWEMRKLAFQRENRIIPFEEYNHAYLESKLKNYETIVQTPVDFKSSLNVLENVGLNVELVEGKGTDLFWLGGIKTHSS